MNETEVVEALEPGELEAEPEPDADAEQLGPRERTEARCEAEATVGGTRYQCALTEGHAEDHAFQPAVDAESEQPSSDKAMAKAVQRLAGEAERHYKRLGEIMGEDAADLVPCVLCSPTLAGWRFDVAPDDETIKRVRVAIGLPDLSNYRPSPWEHRCDDCDGLGRVRTFSNVPGEESKVCDACAGRGWVGTRDRGNTTTGTLPAGAPDPTAPPEYDDGVRRDMFGTPEGDPDYGKLPNMRERPVEYWRQGAQ